MIYIHCKVGKCCVSQKRNVVQDENIQCTANSPSISRIFWQQFLNQLQWWPSNAFTSARSCTNCSLAVGSLYFHQRMILWRTTFWCWKPSLSLVHDTWNWLLEILKFTTFNSAQTYEKRSLAAESHHFPQLILNFWTHVSCWKWIMQILKRRLYGSYYFLRQKPKPKFCS